MIYDIHQHLFNKTILDREVASLAVALADSINVPDNDKRKVRQVLGNIDEFLKRIDNSSASQIYGVFKTPYDKYFDQDQKVYTPLTFDLTYADEEEMPETLRERWIIEKRKHGRKLLKSVARLAGKLPLKQSDVDFKKLLKGLANLLHAVDENDDLMDDQNFDRQIEEMEALVTAFNNDTIWPFYSVEPRQARRADAPVDFIQRLTDKILNGKFKGVKLYSTTGFSPTDPVLYGANGVYSFCVQNNIPVTSHNSDGGFGSFAQIIKIQGHIYELDEKSPDKSAIVLKDKKKVTFKNAVISVNAGKAISERAETLNHPHLWRMVLDKYPNLRLNLAHFGGATSIMELVHYKIPDHLKRIYHVGFTNWLKKFPQEHQERVKEFYARFKDADYDEYRLRSELFDEADDDTLPEIEEKYDRRKFFWELAYSCKLVNNWTKHHVEMIQSNKYPNFYVDLSAFTVGHLLHYEVPYLLQTLTNGSYSSVLDTISDPGDKAYFKAAYQEVTGGNAPVLWKWKLRPGIQYIDHVRLVTIFRKANYLEKRLDDELDLIKKILNVDDAGLIAYLVNNDNYSIMLDLYHFKTKLYDKLKPEHKVKILYGSDFYFTQVFGPRHEQYVQDFKTVFGSEFYDIAGSHCEAFLNI